MHSIIKHFEFKSSDSQIVSVEAARLKGKPVFLAVDLARALGYADPHDALNKHCKSLIKLNSGESTESGFGSRPRGVILAGQADMFRLIMRSNLPSAERLQDWVCETVLPALMETGTYSMKPEKSSSGLPEFRRARTIKLETEAMALALSYMPKLSDVAKQTAMARAVNDAAGIELLPLPKLEEHYHSAGEVGEMLGVSAQKIGRIANAHNLKTDEFGIFVMDKAAHSSKQVEAFRYNAEGVKALRHLIHGADVA